MKAIDLFSGIGGIRIGFKYIFKDLAVVFSSEINEKASETYNLNFKEQPHGDITQINEKDIPEHDILLAGFPCQAFSIAGKRKGFEDTRGTLFFDVARIIKYHKPEIVFLENVKNLKSHDKGNTFNTIKQTLEDLDYKVHYEVLNAKDFGLPQNRERIFIIAFKNKKIDFKFPKNKIKTPPIHTCISKDKVNEKYYYNGKPLYDKIKNDVISKNSIYQWRRKYVRENKNNVCPTLTANMGTGGHNVPIIKDDFGIRKLTPKECSLFQGFPLNYKFPEKMADSHLYQQIGNSVPINLITAIAKNIKEATMK